MQNTKHFSLIKFLRSAQTLLFIVFAAIAIDTNTIQFLDLNIKSSASLIFGLFFCLLCLEYLIAQEAFVRVGTIKRDEHPVLFYMFICILGMAAGIFLGNFLGIWGQR